MFGVRDQDYGDYGDHGGDYVDHGSCLQHFIFLTLPPCFWICPHIFLTLRDRPMGMACGNTMLVPTYHVVILRSGGLAALYAN